MSTPQTAGKTVEFFNVANPDKVQAVCVAVRKHYHAGATVAVLAADAAQLNELMERLWVFSQRDFIPHETVGATDGIEVDRVLLTAEEGKLPEADVLVLGRTCSLEKLGGYETIVDFAEIYDDKLRDAGRERFKQYKAAGYRLIYIK